MSESNKHDSSRRAFLRGSVAVGATAGLVATTPAVASTPADEATTVVKTPKKKGYQVTKHVSDYYRTASN